MTNDDALKLEAAKDQLKRCVLLAAREAMQDMSVEQVADAMHDINSMVKDMLPDQRAGMAGSGNLKSLVRQMSALASADVLCPRRIIKLLAHEIILEVEEVERAIQHEQMEKNRF